VQGEFKVWVPVCLLVAVVGWLIFQRSSTPPDSVPSSSSSTHSDPSDFLSVEVIDGDTIKVIVESGIPVSIRLVGIDAPELGQPFSYEAKEYLQRKLTNTTPRILFKKEGKYGRKVCTILVGQSDLGLEVLKAGLAWATPDSGEQYQLASAVAKKRGLGLWSQNTPQPPWEYRCK
jgi:endonuclease YncB( thermonuclease family)